MRNNQQEKPSVARYKKKDKSSAKKASQRKKNEEDCRVALPKSVHGNEVFLGNEDPDWVPDEDPSEKTTERQMEPLPPCEDDLLDHEGIFLLSSFFILFAIFRI